MPIPETGRGTCAAENPCAPGLSKSYMTRRPKLDLAGVALLGAALLNTAGAQVYRCEEGDTTVFSDMPCSESAELLEMPTGISVVAAADDLDEVARSNKAFIDQRQEKLAARRERARLARQAERDRQRRAPGEEIRYRTIIGPFGDSRFGDARRSQADPRIEAQRQRASDRDEPERRRTLLSRSGGNQPRILR